MRGRRLWPAFRADVHGRLSLGSGCGCRVWPPLCGARSSIRRARIYFAVRHGGPQPLPDRTRAEPHTLADHAEEDPIASGQGRSTHGHVSRPCQHRRPWRLLGGEEPGVEEGVEILPRHLLGELDTTILNVAIPTIRAELGHRPCRAAVVISGYSLTLGTSLIIGGRLSDLLGSRRVSSKGLCCSDWVRSLLRPGHRSEPRVGRGDHRRRRAATPSRVAGH
jgi:hypothetical protein